MGSDAATGLIFFVAAVSVAGVAAAAMTNVVGSVAAELRDRGDGLASALASDIAIVNDPDNVPYSAGTLTLYVKNTGTRALATPDLTILVDGVVRTFTATLLEGAGEWAPGVVAQLDVTATLSAGDHRARAAYMPNISDDLEFRV